MKKFNITAALLIILVQVQAQKITLRSNGYINTFQKIDNLFFHEYSGQRPTTKTSSIDTIFSKTIMKFDNSFGFNRNLGDRFSVGLNILPPVFVQWRNDKIFKDDPSAFYGSTFS